MSCQICSINKVILTYRCYLTTTIYVLFHLGFALNRNFGVTTYQSRVAMCLFTSTCSEYITMDYWFIVLNEGVGIRPFFTRADVFAYHVRTCSQYRSGICSVIFRAVGARTIS